MIWPLKNTAPLFPDEVGRFGCIRTHDIHTGVDLYCEDGTEVISIEDGEVVCIEQFTGGRESPWWNDTYAVLVRGKSGVIVYGEIETNLSVGQWVSQGQKIGNVKTVLKTYKGRPMTMLHIELMTHDSTKTIVWNIGEPQPSNLLDITDILFKAANSSELVKDCGIEFFHLNGQIQNRFVNVKRFPVAKNIHEALYYYRNRSIQFLKFGWGWNGQYTSYDWGIEVPFVSPNGEVYYSVSVFKSNNGFLKKWFIDNPYKKFVTSTDCLSMISWLDAHGKDYAIIDPWFSDEHRAVERHYKELKARRSGIHLMNHIDEGVFILQQLGASKAAINAFCLHPILQSDKDVALVSSNDWNSWSGESIALAMEYRHIANAHLSKHEPKIPVLSPIDDVNKMLIADKIQNYKDFILYLYRDREVPNSNRLKAYFIDEWFRALKVDNDLVFHKILEDLSNRSGGYFQVLNNDFGLRMKYLDLK